MGLNSDKTSKVFCINMYNVRVFSCSRILTRSFSVDGVKRLDVGHCYVLQHTQQAQLGLYNKRIGIDTISPSYC